MSNADFRGQFVWHELMTTDPNGASDFYSKIIPWKTEPSGMPSYTLWMSGNTRAGGLMPLPDATPSGTPSHWIVYIGTPDVDATVEAAQKLGGKVHKGASDIPSVGRFAVLADPQGATFAVFTPLPGPDGAPPPGGGIGDFTWHELATTEPEGALAFYVELFGWSKGAAHDMGPPLGLYHILSHHGTDVGGIYKTRDSSTPSSWLSYVRVSDADKVASIAKTAGGKVLNGPNDVPGGSRIVTLLDPQGGAIAVVQAPSQVKPAKAAKPAKAVKPAEAAKPAQAAKPAVKPSTISKPVTAAPAKVRPEAAAKGNVVAKSKAKAPAKAKAAAKSKAKAKAKVKVKLKTKVKAATKSAKTARSQGPGRKSAKRVGRPAKRPVGKVAKRSAGKTEKRATAKKSGRTSVGRRAKTARKK